MTQDIVCPFDLRLRPYLPKVPASEVECPCVSEELIQIVSASYEHRGDICAYTTADDKLIVTVNVDSGGDLTDWDIKILLPNNGGYDSGVFVNVLSTVSGSGSATVEWDISGYDFGSATDIDVKVLTAGSFALNGNPNPPYYQNVLPYLVPLN